MVLVGMVVTSVVVGVTYFRNAQDRPAGEGFRTAWSLGALYLVLSLGGDVAPEVAGPLALLIMLGVLFAKEETLGGIIKLVPVPSPGGATQ